MSVREKPKRFLIIGTESFSCALVLVLILVLILLWEMRKAGELQDKEVLA